MRRNKTRIFFRIVRNFLFSPANKEFLIFLFFLALSTVFWLMMTLNETYEKEFNVPVKLVNVPRNVVITNDLPSSVKVTARDKGYMIIAYMYSDDFKPITIDFDTYTASGNEHCVINTADLMKQIRSQFNNSTKLSTIKPESIEFYYNYGAKKRVPVVLNGDIIPDKMYYLARVRFWPDSVTIYASESILEDITQIRTKRLVYDGLSDTVIIHTELEKIRGVKCEPNMVKVGLYTDIFTEGNVTVPVHGINMPEGKILRTFPAKVQVTFTTGIKRYKEINPEDFTVVVDYNEISAHPSDKCRLHLRTLPHGIKQVNITQPEVDYLIEQE
jgi:hypothetical protein